MAENLILYIYHQRQIKNRSDSFQTINY